MDNWQLSELCYRNGFDDARNKPIYVAYSSSWDNVMFSSWDLDELVREVKASSYVGERLIVISLVVGDRGEFNSAYAWNWSINKYIEVFG